MKIIVIDPKGKMGRLIVKMVRNTGELDIAGAVI